MAEDQEKSTRKRAAAAAVAVAASASVVTGTLFTDPADLLQPDAATPIVQMVDDGGDGANGDDGSNAGTEDEDRETASPGLRARMRQFILGLPIGVRVLFVLPFWALGWGITTVASALWSVVLSPVLSSALGWVLLILLMVGAFGLAAKAMFPNLPWKKIWNRRSILAIVISGLLLGAADQVLPLVWTGYGRVAVIVRAVGSLLILGAVTTAFALRTHKRRMKARADAEPTIDEAEDALRPLTKEDILAMADSVK